MTNLKLIPEYVLGKGSISYLRDFFVKQKAKKVSLIFGGGSIKMNGLYESILKITKELNITLQEISGIKPNPLASSIWDASLEIRKFSPDYIIAAGGGSVIDASKVIGILATNEEFISVDDYFKNSHSIKNPCIPIISILTLSGTGSENNAGSVVTFDDTQVKKSISTPSGTPILAIEDPLYTFSVNQWQTASGSFDCLSHLLEQYFVPNLFDWTKEFLFANMRNVLKYGPIAFHNPKDYNARKNLMFTTSMSLNDLSSFTTDGDWNVHIIEHAISGKWDVTHGAGLALITPKYMRYRCQKDQWFKDRTIIFGKEVLNLDNVEAIIKFIEDWISLLGLPKNWSDFAEIKSVSNDDIDWLLNHIMQNGGYLLKNDYEAILRMINW